MGRLTWRQEGSELIKDLGVLLLPAVAHDAAHLEREGLQEGARGQVVELQRVLHVVEVAQHQKVRPDAGYPF